MVAAGLGHPHGHARRQGPTGACARRGDRRARTPARGVGHDGESPGVHCVSRHVLLEQPCALGLRRHRRLGRGSRHLASAQMAGVRRRDRCTDPVSAAGDDAGLDPSMFDWIRSVTGASSLRVERRSGGASREGYAVDVGCADGTARALWLRMDTGYGAQSHGTYTLRREAAVYRALAPTPVQVATLVAVHPTDEAFLMERLEGQNWFAELTDPREQVALASAFMRQVAELHRLDPRDLALPELGVPDRVSRHVVEEIDIWAEQYRQQGE